MESGEEKKEGKKKKKKFPDNTVSVYLYLPKYWMKKKHHNPWNVGTRVLSRVILNTLCTKIPDLCRVCPLTFLEVFRVEVAAGNVAAEENREVIRTKRCKFEKESRDRFSCFS